MVEEEITRKLAAVFAADVEDFTGLMSTTLAAVSRAQCLETSFCAAYR
jgi:hypothetical protein